MKSSYVYDAESYLATPICVIVTARGHFYNVMLSDLRNINVYKNVTYKGQWADLSNSSVLVIYTFFDRTRPDVALTKKAICWFSRAFTSL